MKNSALQRIPIKTLKTHKFIKIHWVSLQKATIILFLRSDFFLVQISFLSFGEMFSFVCTYFFIQYTFSWYPVVFMGFPDGWDGKAAMRETWVWSLGREDPLEKEMTIHSSTLAWKIPWTEKPGRLQSIGSQKIAHDWTTSLQWCSRQNIKDQEMSKDPQPLTSRNTV